MSDFRKPRIVGRVIKTLLLLFVLGVNALILWRVFFSTIPPASVDSMIPNETLSAAYSQHDGQLTARYQDQASVTRAEHNYGYFSVTQCVFIPEAKQVQIVVRYNNSTIRHLKEDYELAEMPQREETLFDVTLVKTVDLTPDVDTDNEDPEQLAFHRIFPSGEVIRDHTLLYTYCRYVFDNVSVEDDTLGVFADLYYVKDIHYESTPYGTLCLYDQNSAWLPYKLSKKDLQAMSQTFQED